MSRAPPPTHSMDSLRAVRPPPGSRRALFMTNAPSRRQNPTSVRPDTANIFEQPMEEVLVERDAKGEYSLCAPHATHKHLALGLGRESDDEAEQENQIIDLYGKSNPHWDHAAIKEEIVIALKSSLQKKVASVEEDRWMFEGNLDSLGTK